MRLKLLALLAFLSAATGLRALTPTAEIESLLGYLGGLDGAVFIRNGSEHTAAEAVSHLRLKWDKQRDQIATAEDFIRLCGTQSSLSGQPYQIRFKDGTTRPCADVLTARLHYIRQKTALPAAPK